MDMVLASNVNAPEFTSKAPVVVISISAALPAIFTPPTPARVKAPAVVEKLDAAPASILVPVAESMSIVESESRVCGPSIAVIEPLKNKLFHL